MKSPLLFTICLASAACEPFGYSPPNPEEQQSGQQQSDEQFHRQMEARARLDDWYFDQYRLRCLSLITLDPKSLTAADKCDVALQAMYRDAEQKAGLPYASLNGSSGSAQPLP
ncbi:MAG: hypothetical protein ABSC95_21435, partial [Acetobacteraceae bacterium]